MRPLAPAVYASANSNHAPHPKLKPALVDRSGGRRGLELELELELGIAPEGVRSGHFKATSVGPGPSRARHLGPVCLSCGVRAGGRGNRPQPPPPGVRGLRGCYPGCAASRMAVAAAASAVVQICFM